MGNMNCRKKSANPNLQRGKFDLRSSGLVLEGWKLETSEATISLRDLGRFNPQNWLDSAFCPLSCEDR